MKRKVYILKSLKDDARYIGMSIDLTRRLNEHNSGKNRYTKAHIPWEVIYMDEFDSWEEARIREKIF